MKLILAITFAAAICTIGGPVLADDVDAAKARAIDAGGAWHYKSFRCVDSTVTLSGPRLEGDASSGSGVLFATSLGVEHAATSYDPHPSAGVVTYNPIRTISKEHKGDRVQVCLLQTPLPIAPCNPDTDSRGRVYRIYDYEQHAAYHGMNAEHDCGGA